jgi:hypothetical protein
MSANVVMTLAEKIRAIERRYAQGAAPASAFPAREAEDRLATGWADIDAVLEGGLAYGGLHEWFGVEGRAGSTLTPALSLEGRGGSTLTPTLRAPALVALSLEGRGGSGGRSSREPWSPPVCIPVHLAWRVLEATPVMSWTVWIGRRCFPYPRVLIRGRGADDRLLQRSIFVAPRDAAGRLWAIDLALRSPAVGAVIADGSGLTMAATRRIQLTAQAHRTPAFLVRPPAEVEQLSAARTRWRVRWGNVKTSNPGRSASRAGRQNVEIGAATACPFRAASRVRERLENDNPRWIVELLRCKGASWVKEHMAWVLEWDRGASIVRVSTPLADSVGRPQEAAHVAAVPSAG